MKSFLSSLRKLDSSTHILRDRIATSKQFRLLSSLSQASRSIDKSVRNGVPGISLSLCTSLLTIGTSIGIGITVNPQRSWAGACVGVYSTKNVAATTGSAPTAAFGSIGYYNSIDKTYVEVAKYTAGANINAIATQPSTGNLFFINRATGKTVVYDVNTGTQTTLTGSITSNNTSGSVDTIIGATFDPDGKLYIYYSGKRIIEIAPGTGSQIGSDITITGIPGTGSNQTTNGDIAIGKDGILYAIGDTSLSGSTYTSQLYSIAISGTTATATAVNNTTTISGANGEAINGLAIDPANGTFYISSSGGTYELNTTSKAANRLTTNTAATGITNDLAACGSPTPNLPTITKAFGPNNVVGTPANSTLTLTLGNTNTVPIYLISTLTDTFQAGLTVRSPNGLGGTCLLDPANTNKITAVANSGSISLLNGLKVPATGCTVTVNVTANAPGIFTNTIAAGALKTTAGNNTSATTNILTVPTTDYGDAPITGTAPNGTGTNAYGEAIHGIVTGMKLGATISAETTSIANATASGDGTTDDGISSFPTLTAGVTSYSIPAANITVTGTGTLHAWIDFNKNGTFEAGEHTSVAVTSNTLAGALNWTGITAGAAGNTFARFRFTSDSTVTASTPSGIAADGEVEDYQVSIEVAPPPPITAGVSYCASPYGEVYATRAPNTLYAIHGPTGAATLLTTSTISSVAAINGMATDHVNKLVYYADANGIYAWNALTNTHITVTSNFTSFLPSSYTSQYSVTTLSSGGAAFYNGSLYVGVDGRGVGNSANSNPHFEIFKVDFTPNGQSVTAVTPLDVVGKSAIGNPTEQLKRTDEDWGDFTISDTGMILALSTRNAPSTVAHIWNYNLNAAAGTNPYTNLGTPTGGNHQIAKSGDGKLWALFSSGKVQEITAAGGYLGTAIDIIPVLNPVFSASDGGECVVGNSSVGDRVWADTNSNGIQDPGELGISGVSVSIYRDINKNGVLDTGEPLLATKITDVNGNYNFIELLPHDTATGTNHNDFIVKVTGGVPSGYTATSTTATTGATTAIDLSSASQVVTTADFSYVQTPSNPNLLLVKRITAINGNTTNGNISLNSYDPETVTTERGYHYDTNVIQSGLTPPNSNKWPDTTGAATSTFLLGARNGGTIKPNDTVEYTIYFLSAGNSAAKNVLFCDRVPENVTFIPNSFNSVPADPRGLSTADRGIAIRLGNTLTSYTNINDNDIARYYLPLEPLPNGCKAKITDPPLPNPNGAVVVNIDNIPNAMTAGDADTYGFIRFRGRVK